MTLTTKNFGALAGVAEPEAAVDPNAPVEQPRRCGTCRHFNRWGNTSPPHGRPWYQRLGFCTLKNGAAELPDTVARPDNFAQAFVGISERTRAFLAQPGPPDEGGAPEFEFILNVVGDLFGCFGFEARR